LGFALKLDAPGQPPKSVPLMGDKILLGSLLSNHVVLQGKGVEPIHALIEAHEDGGGERWVITDLGSEGGIKLNGSVVEVEAEIRPSDVVEIGEAKLVVEAVQVPESNTGAGGMGLTLEEPSVTTDVGTALPKLPTTVSTDVQATAPRHASRAALFNVREARPRGEVLEVVAYWDKTIIEAEYFHRDFKEFNKVTIGTTDVSHFIAANRDTETIKRHVLAEFSGSGYRLNLIEGMTARVRKGGKVSKIEGSHRISLGKRDLVQVTFGAIRYFLIFVKPPNVILPPARNRDPFFSALLMMAMLFYFISIPTLWYASSKITKDRKDDIWAVVYQPVKKPKPIKKVKVKKKIEKVKKAKPPKKRPPPPKPKPVKPVKPLQKPKPKKIVKKAKRPPIAKSLGVKKRGKVAPKPKARPKPAGGRSGIKSTGVGSRRPGGGRKGKSRSSLTGVKGVANKKASGVNLSKLGLDVGQVLSKRGPGAQYTTFKSSAGGAGGGRGSRLNTRGLGGLGNERSLSLKGSKGAANKFGTGQGLVDRGGRGGGKGFGSGRGRGGVAVNIPPGDPVVSGGLTAGEISSTIRQNLNQIRHCYERYLQRAPGKTGKVSVKFVINTGGRVASASVRKSNISDRSFRNCIPRRIKKWKFPRPRGGSSVTVNYPFIFNPL